MSTKLIRKTYRGTVLGLPAIFSDVFASNEIIVDQKIKLWRSIDFDGKSHNIVATLRFDDACRNGVEGFAVTGEIIRLTGGVVACGAIHDEITKAFPELAHLLKWHLSDIRGPSHYPDNVLWFAGDTDSRGLRKGERKVKRGGPFDKPMWKLAYVDSEGAELSGRQIAKSVFADEQPECPYSLAYVPDVWIGEGKERELDLARSSAVWPEATDEELCVPKEQLREQLMQRLPDLCARFKADMLAVGFVWPEREGG